MTTTVKTQQEFYDLYKDEVTSLANELTDFSEGSMHDIISGALSAGMNELSELLISEFVKTFFSLAEGQDLENLAVDHFGSDFEKPEASFATGVITFNRPNDDAGDVTIPVGTIVKTEKDANGEEISFETTEEVILTGTTITAPIAAVVAGLIGNITSSNKIVVLESTLTDATITVTNASNTAGGENEPDDDEYREIIKNLIIALAGATEAAVVAAALSVAGVDMVKPTTRERVVIDYDIAEEDIEAGATFFRIPYPVLYIADANGNSSDALIQAVLDRILSTRGCGVRIDVQGAIAVDFSWTGSLTLNAGGPNFAELSTDLSMIEDSMTEYVNTVLEIGEGFNKAIANAYIMSIWGPSGTNDITAFSSSVPSGNVSIAINEKLIADVISIV